MFLMITIENITLMIFTISIILLCVIEFLFLLHDNGNFSKNIRTIKDLRWREGWIAVIKRIYEKCYGKIRKILYGHDKSVFTDKVIHIAFHPTGGLGDYIISAKVLEELLSEGNCVIDVFVEKIAFGNAVYGERENVSVYPYSYFNIKYHEYDLVLRIEHFIHIIRWDERRVNDYAHPIYEKVKYIQMHWDELYVGINEQWWRERIQFERCRISGLNRWTELRMGKAFSISNFKVTIPMNKLYYDQFCNLDIFNKRYITINYGADVMRIGQTQLKLWPRTHFELLVKLVKSKFPNVQIVQLGGSSAEKINGVDTYVFGKSIELTKWILKQSICHIDCEGGLVHLATQLNTICIVIFGPTPMHMYSYSQNINLVSKLCSNCMGLHQDWAYKCYCDYEPAQCMYDINPETVFDEVDKLLSQSRNEEI